MKDWIQIKPSHHRQLVSPPVPTQTLPSIPQHPTAPASLHNHRENEPDGLTAAAAAYNGLVTEPVLQPAPMAPMGRLQAESTCKEHSYFE